jgi:hypothetical protein
LNSFINKYSPTQKTVEEVERYIMAAEPAVEYGMYKVSRPKQKLGFNGFINPA